jgi:hypothetical protein
MIIGTFSGPPAPTGGSASANEYSTVQELLYKMPDNTANLIQAKDVRDSVYTLWERISNVEIIASQSATASVTYTNLNPTPQTVGGILAGSTFSNQTMQQMFDALLYPYISPLASLSGGGLRELGASNILTIVVNGTPITVTGNSQLGTQSATATQNANTTFSMTVSDIPNGSSTVSSSTSLSWSSAVYWGKTPTFTPPSMTIVGTKPVWADGAGIGSGKALSTSRAGNYDGIFGAGQYLVFSWPTSYGTPTFKVNGLVNTAFTKIINGISHTNIHGYVSNYDVWISDTAQNSSIDSLVIS